MMFALLHMCSPNEVVDVLLALRTLRYLLHLSPVGSERLKVSAQVPSCNMSLSECNPKTVHTSYTFLWAATVDEMRSP